MTRTVSPKGRKFLYAHEGVVKKAYRDAVGVWTIGAGLTAASGVIVPKAGMVITDAENDRLVDLALQRNYIPRVLKALGASTSQHALDAGASFDYNTGKILSATWVKAFLDGKAEETRQRLGFWNKGGGKVLPGLTRRRAEEADVLLLGKYPAHIDRAAPVESSQYATFVVPVSAEEIEDIRAGFGAVGFPSTASAGKIARSAVEAFQAAYDLTVDGKIGRATLSTLQRELDARGKALKGIATTAGGGSVAGGAQLSPEVFGPDVSATGADQLVTLVGVGVTIAAVAYLAWQAYAYRDIIAVRLRETAPRLAAWLRSF